MRVDTTDPISFPGGRWRAVFFHPSNTKWLSNKGFGRIPRNLKGRLILALANPGAGGPGAVPQGAAGTGRAGLSR